MDFYNILREGHLVKEGTSAVSWESLQPLDAWAIKGGVSPAGPPGFPPPRGRKHTEHGPPPNSRNSALLSSSVSLLV